MNTIIMIPSRMASSRFPGKPLAKLNGKPMIQIVWEKALSSKIGEVYVACSEIEVFNLINKNGGNAIMTDPNLPSGTDRIHAALQKINLNNKIEFVINLQGDMPLIKTEHIRMVLEPLKNNLLMSTIATDLKLNEIENSNVTKIKVDWLNPKFGIAKDFFRLKDKINSKIFHHVGIYGYTLDALNKFVKLPKSKNELELKLEQFRAMDANINIGVIYAPNIQPGVDTKEDLIYAESIIRTNNENN